MVKRARLGGRAGGKVPARHPLAQWIAAVLAIGAVQAAQAGGPQVLSGAWLSQQQGMARVAPGSVPSRAPANLASYSSSQLLQQKVVQQSIANLNNAAQAVAAQMAAQQQAAQKALQLAGSPVPNGLAPGGLQVAANGTWQNVNAPTQSSANGRVTVQVKQTAQKAIATWDSFNVGRQTTLHFDQSGGNQSNGDNDWIVLNRVLDPSGVPSRILGQIKAEGTVYLLNRNGILFGAGSQVNTHSFLASSLDLFSSDVSSSDSDFLNEGIASTAGRAHFLSVDASDYLAGDYGDVVIQQGASITAGKEGFALVAAPDVSNAGSVVDDEGQVILAAGLDFSNASSAAPLEIYSSSAKGFPSTDPDNGTASNTGLVQARRGSVSILGYNVEQAGVALASTSISYPGSIDLIAADYGSGGSSAGNMDYTRSGNLALEPGSVTAVLPEKDGTTTTSSAAADAAFTPSSLTLFGNSVTFASGSLLEAPGAALSVAAQIDIRDTRGTAGRIYVDDGAIVDVSGLADVELPISATLVTIPRVGQNELADSPLLRDSFLFAQKNVVVDSTRHGVRADGLEWVGSPILNASGYVENVPRDIEQMMTAAGSIGLSGDEVIVRSGAQLNLDGGYVAYQAGWVSTPNLLGADGQITNIGHADPNVDYVGWAGQYTENHARWGVSQTWNNPLLAGVGHYDSGYVVGSDAGSLEISAGAALVLDGEITAQAFAGRDQVTDDERPAGGTLGIDSHGTLLPSGKSVGLGFLLQQSTMPLEALDPDFRADTPWSDVLAIQDATATDDDDLRLWLPVSADTIEQGGFQTVALDTSSYGGQILEQPGTALDVHAGGSIDLTANRITILGELGAPSGSIALTSSNDATALDAQGQPLPADITVGSDAVLDVDGLWVNDTGLASDALVGDAYINGGSIALSTGQMISSSGADATGSILLEPGSLLDASGGGYVDHQGVLATTDGVPDGSGGNISLQTYVPGVAGYGTSSGVLPPPVLDSGSIEMDGTLRAHGFSGGGTLTLQAAQIQIGGDPADMALTNGLYLAPSFFAGQGFADYVLSSSTDATIAAGSVVRVTNDNLLPNEQALLQAPTGTDLYASDAAQPGGIYATVGQLDPYHRYVTVRDDGETAGFSLSAGGYLNWSLNPFNHSGAPSYAGVTGSLLLDTGASILADAGSTVSLDANRATTILGEVSAPGGDIAVGAGDQLTGQVPLPTGTSPQVWLGAGAVLDASGTSLVDPWAAAVTGSDGSHFVPRTGEVLAGGNVVLEAVDGYLLGESGGLIDVSGAADTYDVATAGDGLLAGGVAYPATAVWSDAGNITLGATAGLYLDSSLQARGGAPLAAGGSLTLAGLGAPNTGAGWNEPSTGILLQQSGNLLPAGLQPGGSPEAAVSGVLHFAVDRLDGSGIGSLTIGPDSTATGTVFGVVVPLGFAGDVTLDLGKSFVANASAYIALPAGSTGLATTAGTYAQGTGTVSIDAAYVDLVSTAGRNSVPVARAGDGVLQVDADFIDLGGWLDLEQWADADFTSSGDLRFELPPAYAYTNGAVNPGQLFTTGNLTFQVAQLYPATGYAFVVDANPSGLSDAAGHPLSTTLTILPNGRSTAPLSAGGMLVLDADAIEQEGTVRVPSGNLVLGVGDPATEADELGLSGTAFPLVATDSVHLAAGSITSVSLDNATVPFGTTTDGTDWTYSGDPLNDSADLKAPPAKRITLDGSHLALDQGATVDLSGGGELQAEEWDPGTGGSRDVLSQYETDYSGGTRGVQVPQYADGRAVYAILPGYAVPVSAQDAALEKGVGAGPAVGEQVYLSGADGLPAGYYTLLPGKYATLPGAYRVVVDTGATRSVLGDNAVLPDGTLSVTGYVGNALDGSRSALPATFLVQPGPVWQQYSQYSYAEADTYFGNQADAAGTVAPPLPRDAGHLVLDASASLALGTTLTAAPADGGRGSEVDIAAQAIAVTGGGQATAADAGDLVLSADGLTALGADSLLLGGTRTAGSAGDVVDTVADAVIIDNDRGHALAGPEILLVANGDGSAAAPGVVVGDGAYIEARGSASGNASDPLVFGSAGDGDAAVSGDGALLRVSQNGTATVTRYDTTDGSAGALSIGAGAMLDGGNALTLDATGLTQVDPTATLVASAIDASVNRIVFSADAGVTVSSGLVVGPATLAQLAGADSVTLRSRSGIDFLGDVAVDVPHALELDAGAFTSDGGQVSLGADTLTLGNSLGGTTPDFAAGGGQLSLHARELDFGSGDSTLQGFGGVNADASAGMVARGSGGIDFGNLDVSLSTPVLLADNGSDIALSTTGALSVMGGGGTPLSSDGMMGGQLALSGGTLSVATEVAAPAGDLGLTATSGDLTVAAGARLDTAGVSKVFQDVTAYAPGGALSLTAGDGDVDLQAGAELSFGGARQGGDAGSLTIDAGGKAILDGHLDGQADAGYRGGFFTLSTGDALDLDSLASLVQTSGTTGAVSITSGAGNLVLTAGHTLAAQDVFLEASGGYGGMPGATDGNVIIDGTVSVSGPAAGNLQLYGRSGVDVEGSLLAASSTPGQAGGNVTIGTSGVGSTTQLDPTYGYEEVRSSASGSIHLGAAARIDVSGGGVDALGGTVSLRAPLLADGDVNIAIDGGGSAIAGARNVTLEPYAVWSTDDVSTDPAKHFDGIIDPAGWYQPGAEGAPQLVAGFWTDTAGNALPAPSDEATLQTYLQNDYFTPASANADHETFYGYVNGDPGQGAGTLMKYVEQPGYTFVNRFADVANLRIRPGVELENPDASVNGGDISVLTNWNLGAGITHGDGSISLAYRYAQPSVGGYGQAPMLTFLALDDLDVQASISDGFYQQNDGAVIASLPSPAPTYAGLLDDYNSVINYLTNDVMYAADSPLWLDGVIYEASNGYAGTSIVDDPYYQPIQAPLANQSAAYYGNYQKYIDYDIGDGSITLPNGSTQAKDGWAYWYNYDDNGGIQSYATHVVAGEPDPSAFGSYAGYLSAYFTWLTGNFDASNIYSATPPPLLAPGMQRGIAPGAPATGNLAAGYSNYAAYSTDYGTYAQSYYTYYHDVVSTGFDVAGTYPQLIYAPFAPTADLAGPPEPPGSGGNPIREPDNSPSNMPSVNNPASFASATLLGGSSSSYRMVAGADFSGVDPLAVASASVGAGNVDLGGHFAVVDTTLTDEDGHPLPSVDDKSLLFPTTIRTGTGSIDIVAAGNIDWRDATAPASIYTAGEPAPGTIAGTGVSVLRPAGATPDMVVTGPVNPVDAGDIDLSAGGDIIGIENVVDIDGSVTGTKGAYIGQFWWPWMETGNTDTRSSIDFAGFDQGVLSAGGNVSISAGGEIDQLAVSLPTTWYIDAGSRLVTVGGGDLAVRAGGDILGGSYFVAKGSGTIVAGGRIGAIPGFDYTFNNAATEVSTLLALQDAQLNVVARDGVDIGGVYDPSYFASNRIISSILPVGHFDGQSYGTASSLNVMSVDGDFVLDSLSEAASFLGLSPGGQLGGTGDILPATVSLTALNGDLDILGSGELYPSATGNLTLLANGSINLSGQTDADTSTINAVFGLIDTDASALPSPLNPDWAALGLLLPDPRISDIPLSQTSINESQHAATPLHGADDVPVRVYALNGDIVDGITADDGYQYRSLVLEPSKPAEVYAGNDIVNLSFLGQQVHDADVTRIVAGRDIYDTELPTKAVSFGATGYELAPSLLLGGVGSFQVQAGRNIGPLANQSEIATNVNLIRYPSGIESVGNAYNPYLPHAGANVDVLYGVGPGTDTVGFLTAYLDSTGGTDGFGSLLPDLVAFMEQREAGGVVDTGYAQDKITVALTAEQARADFDQLPTYVQQLFAQRELFKMLARVDGDYNDPSSPYYQQYARGYIAINTLFPAALGYTDNGSGAGGLNGEAATMDTGDLDIRSSTIQTQQGGNVTILGPGGQALVGSTGAPPVITSSKGQVLAGPNTMGILTLEQGDIDILTDRSLLLAQSRIFTEQGGDLTIWSSNGDINAGQGAKTVAEMPAPTYVCTVDAWCRKDAKGEVSGAGIATLQTVPGAATGNVYLIAPRGTVDAGDAGIRVSGNIYVAAARVLNADNIQVQGEKIGIPVAQAVNVGALTAASAAASAVSKVADDMARRQQDDARNNLPSVISVRVIGSGGDDSSSLAPSTGTGYDPDSPVQVLGAGHLDTARLEPLTTVERERLDQ